MIKFPLNPNTRAELLDNKHAFVYSLVIDPAKQTVLDFVLQDAGQQRWLVPLKYVIDGDDELVRLRITSEEFNQMPRFDDSQYLLGSDEENDFFKAGESGKPRIYFLPDMAPDGAVALEKDLALIRGAFVEAQDGFIGTVEEIAIDPKTGAAQEIIIHTEGRDKHEITLPVTMIERAEVDTVYLKIDREKFESLPSVRVKYSKTGKMRYHMLAVVFESLDGARDSFRQWKQLWAKQTTRFIHSAAIIEQDLDGKISLSETLDIDKRHGRLFGAVTGGLVGLVGGPIGLVVGALAGAGVGGLTADKIDRGISNRFLESFAQNLKPGSSALIILIDSEGVPALRSSLGQLGGILVQEELTQDMLEKFSEESADE